MPGADDQPGQGNQAEGFVTQAQLQETTEKITQAMQAQIKALTDELLSRFPVPAAQRTTPIPHQPSSSHRSTADGSHRFSVPPVPPPKTPIKARGSHLENTPPARLAQPPPRACPRRLEVSDDTAESPDPSHHSADPSVRRSGPPRKNRTTAARKLPMGCGQAYCPIADALGGITPLTDAIMMAPVEKFKMPSIEKYRGKGGLLLLLLLFLLLLPKKVRGGRTAQLRTRYSGERADPSSSSTSKPTFDHSACAISSINSIHIRF